MKALLNPTKYKLQGTILKSLFSEEDNAFIITRDGGTENIPTQAFKIHLNTEKRGLTPQEVAIELGLDPSQFEKLEFYEAYSGGF